MVEMIGGGANAQESLQEVTDALQEFLWMPRSKAAAAFDVEIRSCVAWAMEFDCFGFTQFDITELRSTIASVLERILESESRNAPIRV